MLDRSRDTDSDVEIRRNDLARLSNLQRVVGVARVDGCTGSTDGGSEGVGEGNDGLVEGVLGLDTATAGNDRLGGGEVGTLRNNEFLRDPLGLLCRQKEGQKGFLKGRMRGGRSQNLRGPTFSAAATSTDASLEPSCAGSHVEARTVKILMPSSDLTVEMAFPA